MKISVIIPTFNEEATIEKTLDALSRLVNVDEIIVVDGGSTDKTTEIIENYNVQKPFQLIKTEFSNRGKQLHAGTLHANGEIFWFIHADTRPIQGSARQIKSYMKYKEVVGGHFKIIFSDKSRWARFLTWYYTYLEHAGLVYGDSAIFVRRQSYEKIGGFQPFPIFADVDLCKRLMKKGRFVLITLPVTVSSRRFQQKGVALGFTGWAILQGLHRMGIPLKYLTRFYQPAKQG
jgi:rSAM/selenodomain-associated transferase 2